MPRALARAAPVPGTGRESGWLLLVAAATCTAGCCLANSAQAAFTHHARRYGTRRLRAELRAEGHAVGRYALRSWLRRHGLRALSPRPLRPRTTVADPAAVVAENCLLRQPVPTAPNQVWIGDIAYLPLVGGRWCYLAT